MERILRTTPANPGWWAKYDDGNSSWLLPVALWAEINFYSAHGGEWDDRVYAVGLVPLSHQADLSLALDSDPSFQGYVYSLTHPADAAPADDAASVTWFTDLAAGGSR